MRLLEAKTLEFKQFFDIRERPPYAILSHTWGEEEVTFQEMEQYHHQRLLPHLPSRLPLSKPVQEKAGFAKIQGCAERAIQDGLEYIWVDTCCIDKTSSAELSEAINSMFRWYRDSIVCYAYLSDVQGGTFKEEYAHYDPKRYTRATTSTTEFARSRWFTRGWTLQELLAPQCLVFFDSVWEPLAQKKGRTYPNAGSIEDKIPVIADEIAVITGIDKGCLNDFATIFSKDFATRMSWASRRVTARKEDEAYCLLGLFDVHMPLLYGEGERAFIRLQEEIMKDSEDLSLLAWGLDSDIVHAKDGGLLARSPLGFSNADQDRLPFPGPAVELEGTRNVENLPPTITSRGLRVTLPVIRAHPGADTVYAILRRYHGMIEAEMLLPLVLENDNIYWRPNHIIPRRSGHGLPKTVKATIETIYIRKYLHPSLGPNVPNGSEPRVAFKPLKDVGYHLTEWHPANGIKDYFGDKALVRCRNYPELVLKFNVDHNRSSKVSLRPRAVVLRLSRSGSDISPVYQKWRAVVSEFEDRGQGMVHVLAAKPGYLAEQREIDLPMLGTFLVKEEVSQDRFTDSDSGYSSSILLQQIQFYHCDPAGG